MGSAEIIKDLRQNIGLSRKEFSEYVGIPLRTLEDWEAGRRTPPEYIPILIAYRLKYDELLRKKSEEGKDVENPARIGVAYEGS